MIRKKIKLMLISTFLCFIYHANAQNDTRQKMLEIYGFVMTDVGYNMDQINPDWFDALRITRLPKYKDQFAPDGQTFFSIRQSQFGVKGYTQTTIGELRTRFDFDLFGVGAEEGETHMRLRHVYGELGKFLIGQTNSPFMDGDVFPNTVEYWGPTGMVFYRNVQIRFAPVRGKNEFHIALERPGASADKGTYEEHIELDSVKGRQQLPDMSAHYKMGTKWGHIQLAGMLRPLKWEDVHKTGGYDLSGSVTGWGAHLSTVIKLGKKNVFRGSIVYGEGIENYMNDAPIDVGTIITGNSQQPLKGEALPVTGTMAFLEHTWSSTLSTTLGYSSTFIENTDNGAPDAYKKGQYAIVNLVATLFKNFTMVSELQYGKRENFKDGFESEAIKIQFSFKYNFSQIFYKNNDG